MQEHERPLLENERPLSENDLLAAKQEMSSFRFVLFTLYIYPLLIAGGTALAIYVAGR